MEQCGRAEGSNNQGHITSMKGEKKPDSSTREREKYRDRCVDG